ncbi:MAG: HPr-rel-A system PqqD family peptide chaperone [Candidatus Competibacteraceae bacterium]
MKQDDESWRLNPCARLHWLSWDEDHIVFNAASGQTHVLNELGAAILHLLEENTLNSVEIGRRIVNQYEELVLDTELAAAIDALLENLDMLGLIEPYPKCA